MEFRAAQRIAMFASFACVARAISVISSSPLLSVWSFVRLLLLFQFQVFVVVGAGNSRPTLD